MEILDEVNILLRQCDNVCRVCLSPNEKNQSIFSSDMNHHFHCFAGFCDTLQFFGGIEVKHGDGLPSRICNECISKLHIAYDFRTQCQTSDKRLRSVCKNVADENYITSSRGCKDKRKGQHKSEENIPQRDFSDIQKSIDSVNTELIYCNDPNVNDSAITNEPSSRLVSAEKCNSENIHKALRTCDERKKIPLSFDNQTLKIIAQKTEVSIDHGRGSKDENSVPNRIECSTEELNSRRITSIENLNNEKERQRQSAKKPTFSKSRREDRESRSVKKNRLVRRARSEQLEKSLENRQFIRDRENFSESTICRICNKSFRKVLTMVRHLNVHKREKPRAVYAILKEIRDKRRKRRSKLSAVKNSETSSSLENLSRLDESKPEDLRESIEDPSLANLKFHVDDKNTNNGENPTAESEIPSDDRSAMKLINTWIREELDSDNEGKGFPCNVCNKSYVTKKSLLKHTLSTHEESLSRGDRLLADIENNEETKHYRCKDCEKTFENETKLERHVKIHEREKEQRDTNFKRFLCHICSKTFRQNTGLVFHMRTHTGYKPHVCKFCGRGFTSSSNCVNHERTHTGDRPFVCHFCSAAFAKSCTLKAHITTHTGEANYHCKTCGKSFRRLKYLKEHKFTHTGEKPYVCKICGTGYSHSGSLFVHEKKCKAQNENFQNTMGNYSDERTDFEDGTSLPTDRSTFQDQRLDNISSNTNDNKLFADYSQRINQNNDNTHSSMPMNTRNFNFIGQIFHSQ